MVECPTEIAGVASRRGCRTRRPGAHLKPELLFEPILEELEQLQVSADYWQYVRSRMERMEKLWIQGHRRGDSTCDQSRLLDQEDA